VLKDLDALEKKQWPLAQSVVAASHGISIKNVSKWNSEREKLFYAQEQGFGSSRSLVLKSRVLFPMQEDKLYIAFVYRRRKQGLITPDRWLQDSMQLIVSAEKPEGWENFKASAGWVWRFKKRYRISVQCQTNKKHIPIIEKLPAIRKFHFWLLRQVQLSSPQRCARYGRFPAHLIFHMDQIPLPFVLCSKRTNNEMGQPNFIRAPKGSGLDKRQATLMLCIRADGHQIVRLAIIFGKNSGQHLSEEEKKCFHGLRHLIQVYFQDNAWADQHVMLHWLDQFSVDTAALNGEQGAGSMSDVHSVARMYVAHMGRTIRA
jgi:hypothetical protein